MLVERERSGAGQSVSVSLAHSFLAYDTWNWLLLVLADRYERAFESAPPFDTDALVPNTPFVFRLLVALSADGQWLQFSQTTDRLWEAFLRTCALDPTDDSVRDAPLSDDPAVRVEFWERLLAAVRSRTADEWLEVFDHEPDVWADTFRAGPSALTHPQLVADDRVVRDQHGYLIAGRARGVGTLVRVRARAVLLRSAPTTLPRSSSPRRRSPDAPHPVTPPVTIRRSRA